MQSMTNDSQIHFHENDISRNHIMHVLLLPGLNVSYMMIVVMSKSDIGKMASEQRMPNQR
jgi:hypothetical protein